MRRAVYITKNQAMNSTILFLNRLARRRATTTVYICNSSLEFINGRFEGIKTINFLCPVMSSSALLCYAMHFGFLDFSQYRIDVPNMLHRVKEPIIYLNIKIL